MSIGMKESNKIKAKTFKATIKWLNSPNNISLTKIH